MDEEWYSEQLSTQDQQIEKLQSALNQSLQIQAISEKRYEVEAANRDESQIILAEADISF